LNSSYFEIDKKSPIIGSIIKAIITHLYIAWIHPFGDGNGRLARILEFGILLSSGVPSPAAHLLSNHYNATRQEYYRQLERASQKNDVIEFVSYAVQGFLDGLNDQLEYVHNQVIDISWESYIYETFDKYKHSAVTTKRRRTLMLAISRSKKSIPRDKLITLNEKTIEAYRKKTDKTVDRDIKELQRLDLVEKTKDGYLARVPKIFGFLPVVNT